jgi:hypothetical protein
MFPVAAELKDELRTRMLQARTREGAEPVRDPPHLRAAASAFLEVWHLYYPEGTEDY